ncbi:MAG: VOC family protein [Alphaproteobacteria bacterium]|nr:VOC family protein [Alphaproteobacteria bacterium]
MQANAYLMFNGDCEEALRYYAKVTGGTIEAMMPHRGTPAEAQTPEEWRDKIIHARLKIGDTIVMASDAPPGHQHKETAGFSICLRVDSDADAERIFAALADGARATGMPMGPTFFASRFGMVTDRFGTPWMVIHEKKSGT